MRSVAELCSFLLLLIAVSRALAAPPYTNPLDAPLLDRHLPSLPAQEPFEDLNRAFAAHTTARLHRASTSSPRNLETFTTLRREMRNHFTRLTSPHTHGHTETLGKINILRLAGYRFTKDIDPGLHVPLGTPWSFERFGPYPSTRLANLAYAKGDMKRGVLEIELDNALEALDRQTLLESSRRASGKMVYTDDTPLLRSAIVYHRGRLEEGVRDVGDVLGKLKL